MADEKNYLGRDRFVEYSENSPDCPIVTDDQGMARHKYGYPATVKPGHPGAAGGLKHPKTVPNCEIVTDDCGCPVVKYGYPAVPK
jgi:hypothetical protein